MEKNSFREKVRVTLNDSVFEEWFCRQHGIFHFPVYTEADYMQEDISAMDLSARSYNALKRAGFTTVGSLVRGINSAEDLMKIRNCGVKSRREIMLYIFLYQYTRLAPGKREEYKKKVIEMNADD